MMFGLPPVADVPGWFFNPYNEADEITESS
jgi:hypothetical protein